MMVEVSFRVGRVKFAESCTFSDDSVEVGSRAGERVGSGLETEARSENRAQEGRHEPTAATTSKKD